MVIGLGFLPASQIAANNHFIPQKDTRTSAKEWIEVNIPTGSKITIEGSRVQLFQGTVPLRFSKENLLVSRDYYRANNEPGRVKYVQMQLNILSGVTYDLQTVDIADVHDWQYYKNAGVQYVVARPESFLQIRRFSGWPALIQELRKDPDAELIQSFESNPRSTPGPKLEIYRIGPNIKKPSM